MTSDGAGRDGAGDAVAGADDGAEEEAEEDDDVVDGVAAGDSWSRGGADVFWDRNTSVPTTAASTMAPIAPYITIGFRCTAADRDGGV